MHGRGREQGISEVYENGNSMKENRRFCLGVKDEKRGREVAGYSGIWGVNYMR